ncbi:Alpha/beta hydrolase fold-1 [Bisporella sp. PMI_857]|nr:Alpha/beta hydrolase fold-1 [Bisporella sp. PMI_857]
MEAGTVSSEKPTILFVPGAWHLPAGFDTVREQLKALGYPTEAVAHPSIGAEPPTKNLSDDTANLRATLETLADEGKRIVVVTHSYGGVVGSCAVEDAGFAQRASAGKKGGVIMLIYMTAFVLPKDTSLLDALGGNWLPWMKVSGDYCRAAEDGADIFYHDLSTADQQKWIAQLKHTPTAVFSGKSTYEPWNYMPCMYIFCDNDRAIPPVVQEGMASLMGSDITTFRIASSHSPFLSMPHELVEGIELAVKVGQEKFQA